MNDHCIEIQIAGQAVSVPAAEIDGRTVIATGKWLRSANIFDEEFVEGELIPNAETFVAGLKQSGLKADIFTFAQRLPDIAPRYPFRVEWENAAVVPITTYADWWDKRIEYDVRKSVKRAGRAGVVVRQAEFDDAFVKGICQTYNESSTRQGTTFWHYQKDFETVKRENSTYLERSAFIGAYYQNELIGFIRMVYVGRIAMTLQVICQKKHFDKKPMSALIAKAVEISELRGMSHLVYGRYIYNDASNSLTEFKRRNGFEQVLLPRFYVPLTAIGRAALSLGFHHSVVHLLPQPALAQLRKMRQRWKSVRIAK